MPAWERQAEVFVGQTGCDAAPRGAVEEAVLDEERLVNLFERVLFFCEGRCEGVNANRATVVLLDDGEEQATVKFIEAVSVNFEHFEGVLRGFAIDDAGAAHLGVVADATQEAIGDARGAAGAHCNFGGAGLIDGYVEDVGGAFDDVAKVFVGVELEAEEDSEARAQGR